MGDWILRHDIEDAPWPHDIDLDVPSGDDETNPTLTCAGCGAATTGASAFCSACYRCDVCGLIGPGCCAWDEEVDA